MPVTTTRRGFTARYFGCRSAVNESIYEIGYVLQGSERHALVGILTPNVSSILTRP